MLLPLTPLTPTHFAPYGSYQRVVDTPVLHGNGWSAWMTDQVCLPRPAHFGIAQAPPIQSIQQLQRYNAAPVMLLCANTPLVLLVCQQEQPTPAATQAFCIQWGDLLVLQPGIWHSLCYSTQEGGFHYLLTDQPPEKASLEIASIQHITIQL